MIEENKLKFFETEIINVEQPINDYTKMIIRESFGIDFYKYISRENEENSNFRLGLVCPGDLVTPDTELILTTNLIGVKRRTLHFYPVQYKVVNLIPPEKLIDACFSESNNRLLGQRTYLGEICALDDRGKFLRIRNPKLNELSKKVFDCIYYGSRKELEITRYFTL